MKIKTFAHILNLKSKINYKKNSDEGFLKVVKNLGLNKWQVLFKGISLTINSQLPLREKESYRAILDIKDNTFLIKIKYDEIYYELKNEDIEELSNTALYLKGEKKESDELYNFLFSLLSRDDKDNLLINDIFQYLRFKEKNKNFNNQYPIIVNLKRQEIFLSIPFCLDEKSRGLLNFIIDVNSSSLLKWNFFLKEENDFHLFCNFIKHKDIWHLKVNSKLDLEDLFLNMNSFLAKYNIVFKGFKSNLSDLGFSSLSQRLDIYI